MMTVAEMMTTGAKTLTQDDSLADVQAVMDKFSCHHVPIVAQASELVGLVSQRDVLHRSAYCIPLGFCSAPRQGCAHNGQNNDNSNDSSLLHRKVPRISPVHEILPSRRHQKMTMCFSLPPY